MKSIIFAQSVAGIMAVIAVYLGWRASLYNQWFYVGFNVVIFFINVGLFIWNGNIREQLKKRRRR